MIKHAFIILIGCIFFTNTYSCEITQYFNTEAEAQAYVDSGEAVQVGMVMNAIHFKDLAVFKILTNNNNFPLDRYPEGIIGTPLHEAITCDALDIMNYLIRDKGIKPACAHIFHALNGFHRESLKALLQYDIDITGVDYRGHTPIQVAESCGDTKSLEMLKAYQNKKP